MSTYIALMREPAGLVEFAQTYKLALDSIRHCIVKDSFRNRQVLITAQSIA